MRNSRTCLVSSYKNSFDIGSFSDDPGSGLAGIFLEWSQIIRRKVHLRVSQEQLAGDVELLDDAFIAAYLNGHDLEYDAFLFGQDYQITNH
jgi:hypothetical protein